MPDQLEAAARPVVAEPRRTFTAPAFASYIDGYQVPEADALNQQLVKDILAWREECGSGIRSSNHQGWHSPRDFYQRPEESFNELVRHTKSASAASLRRYWPEFDPSRHNTIWEGWANINGPGAVNGPHAHTYHLSGVYYVKMPQPEEPLQGRLEFLNPAGALNQVSPFDRKLMPATRQIMPKAGQMFIFPSYLRHWVWPHYVEDERISIAFNVAVTSDPTKD